MADLDGFIAALPKVELHLHIEGTFEPELMLTIARRNGLPAPFASVEEARSAYHFADLQAFLDLYYRGMNVLLNPEDFRDLTLAYLDRAAADNVRHAEIFFDPQAHTSRGVPLEVVFEGICGGLDEGLGRHGISSRLLPSFLRDLPEESALACFEACLPFRERITGFGLDSAERGHPPQKFERVFARVREEGFHVVAHAGEEGSADNIAAAVDLLGAERIDHGVRVLDDDALTGRLAGRGTVFTVCPISNVRLKVVDAMVHHPIRRMLQRGLKVTVNSDDPSYFGGYIGDNFRAIHRDLGVTRDEMLAMARNAVGGAFVDEDRRLTLRTELDVLAAA